MQQRGRERVVRVFEEIEKVRELRESVRYRELERKSERDIEIFKREEGTGFRPVE